MYKLLLLFVIFCLSTSCNKTVNVPQNCYNTIHDKEKIRNLSISLEKLTGLEGNPINDQSINHKNLRLRAIHVFNTIGPGYSLKYSNSIFWKIQGYTLILNKNKTLNSFVEIKKDPDECGWGKNFK